MKKYYIQRQILHMRQERSGCSGDDKRLCSVIIIKLLPRQVNPFNPTKNSNFNARKCLLLENCILWLRMDTFKKTQLPGCKLELHCVCSWAWWIQTQHTFHGKLCLPLKLMMDINIWFLNHFEIKNYFLLENLDPINATQESHAKSINLILKVI